MVGWVSLDAVVCCWYFCADLFRVGLVCCGLFLVGLLVAVCGCWLFVFWLSVNSVDWFACICVHHVTCSGLLIAELCLILCFTVIVMWPMGLVLVCMFVFCVCVFVVWVWVLVGFFVVWRLLLRCRLVLLKLIYDFWCGGDLQYLCVNSVVFIVSLVFV